MLEAVIEVRSRETLSWTSKPMCRCFMASDFEPFQRMSSRHYIWASLGWEDPLKEGMATHSSILAWRIPMDRGTWPAIVYGVANSQT